MNLLPDENNYMDDLEELDEIPIEEVIGIGEREDPAQILILKTEFERILKLLDRLKSRRKRATRDGNKDLEKIMIEKITNTSTEVDKLRGLLDEYEREREPEEESEEELEYDGLFEGTRSGEYEERTRPTVEEVEEEEEEEHDLIDELAIILELEEE